MEIDCTFTWVTTYEAFADANSQSGGQLDWHQYESASAVLQRKIANCYGFSALNAALLQAAGINARVIRGWAGEIVEDGTWKTSETTHAWNEVMLDGEWIIVDTTWDRSKSNGISHAYFDPDPVFFSSSHVEDKVIY
jgi:transglutaminase/protease-like cytokinesis protein 3